MRSGGPKSPQGGREPPGTGSPGGEAGAAPAHLAGSAPWRRLLLAGQGTGGGGGRQASRSGDSTPFSFLKGQVQRAPAARGSCHAAAASV